MLHYSHYNYKYHIIPLMQQYQVTMLPNPYTITTISSLIFHLIIILLNVSKLLLFNIYLGFYVAFNTVQVISQRVVGRAEETSTYSSSGFCTVNCRPTASNYQLSHLRLCRELNPGLRGGRQECYQQTSSKACIIHINISLFNKSNKVTTPSHLDT